MGDIHTNLKPTAVKQADLVDLLYQIVSSIKGICTKLDADTGVPLTTYVANCYTAKINTVIYDSRGNVTGKGGNYTITPGGLTNEALNSVLYEIFDAWQTLMAQLDADVLGSSDYQTLYWTSTILWNVTNGAGTTKGNGTTYYFGPASAPDNRNLVDILYALVNSLTLACLHLDADTVVIDVNYNALWYTANILQNIENTSGLVIGNAKSY